MARQVTVLTLATVTVLLAVLNAVQSETALSYWLSVSTAVAASAIVAVNYWRNRL